MSAPAKSSAQPSILHQSKAVWAVAFASVIAFMGIGLVDPILPAISSELNATPSQAMLLFTSYLIITGLAMFFTSFVSSRIGAKKTLLIGLVLIVIFAALAGSSSTVDMIIGFRAGWGLGNALFISTALATIVGAASGGVDRAIILYESALGVGIAIGPLVGGLLGTISWRGPFFGTAVLMAIGLIAILVLLGKTTQNVPRISIGAPLAALRNKALLTLGLVALFYNFGFFTLLAYSPFPLDDAAKQLWGPEAFGAIQLGLVFFGWGICLAFTSVFVAQRLAHGIGRRNSIYLAMGCLAIIELVMAFGVHTFAVVTICVIVGGLFLGVMNTVMTEAVMEATDLPRAVASSTYSGIRFLGGAVAPAVAGPISTHLGAGIPFVFGAGAFAVGLIVLTIGRKAIAHIDREEDLGAEDEAEILTAADS
ncbi:MFS transporter [Microlunatus soli]|uniref:Predicted arabinose efflux permease, MFS family n=1 Tax=Microlunatus soli TaxID=630515 RepID=A0A1H1X375_9ACTN|nr:MFS transporter [Microlunatus soli]SDT03803.1 Predicted arabinose efflux permease, MFS family [Microlunatus soli]